MFSAPHFKCATCGREQVIFVGSWCDLCGGFFCREHLTVRKEVATCAACTVEREEREASSGVSDEEEARIVSLLRADVAATIGGRHDSLITEAAARRRLYAHTLEGYVGNVVDDVQQHLHDTFTDTTWPACPHHPNHPLWFRDGWWHCERINEPVARLGGLSDRRPRLNR